MLTYLVKEEFQLYVSPDVSPAGVKKFMDQWCKKPTRSRVELMEKFSRTIRGRKPLILNWFQARGLVSLGAVEGPNNKLRARIRKSCSFGIAEAIKIALCRKLGELQRATTHPQSLLTKRPNQVLRWRRSRSVASQCSAIGSRAWQCHREKSGHSMGIVV
jgi:hypothetical protein